MDEAVETTEGCDHGDHGEQESKQTAPGSDLFSDSAEEECCGSSSTIETCSSEETHHSGATQQGSSTEHPPPPPTPGWPLKKSSVASGLVMEEEEEENDGEACEQDDAEIEKLNPTKYSEMEMMKERFSKLLLGEDMSGCGKGVCTALAISNAITNLCATIFGQLWRLEPLPLEKKSMWRREMEWLLCVSDHIVEMIPSWQTFPDGTKLEVMTCRPRSDIYINLPALKKLDNMLLEILDSFSDTEFWYVDQGILAANSDGGSSSFRTLHWQEEKWWLPVPRVPQGGLHEKTRKELQHRRECTSQILKASMAINSNTLAEMEVPESYLASLPKNGRASLGDLMYRYVTSDQFAPECLLDCLDLSSDHQALEIANRVEASIYTWRRRTSASSRTSNASKSSWEIVKDMIVDAADKRELLAGRAETLLLCLKQRFPSLTQTSLDTSKIQFNKDIGKSMLESYSRVLESLAFNIVARIDDLLQVDDFCQHSDQPSAVPTVGLIAQKKMFPVPVSGTPLISPARRERSPLIGNSGRKHSGRGFGVKKVLTSYLSNEQKNKNPSFDAAAEASLPPVIPSRNSGVLSSLVDAKMFK